MRVAASAGRVIIGLCLLAATAANAQSGSKPAVPSTPSAPATGFDITAHPASQITRNGVRFVFQERGTGTQPKAGSRVAVRYTGFLPDGHVFDASVKQGGPLKVRVGRGEVIKGWDEALQLLPEGTRARIWIPAQLAYASKGVRDPDDERRYLVPPHTDLVFEVEILRVK